MMQLSKCSKRYAWLTSEMHKVTNHLAFRWTTVSVIILASVIIGLNTYTLPSYYNDQLRSLNDWITLFFVVEIIIRFLAAGNFRKFFSRGWNVFDLLIVFASLLPIEDSEYVLLGRLLRAFRILLLFNAISPLNAIIKVLLLSIPRIGYVSLLLFIIFYIFGVLGSLFFGHIDPSLWDDVGVAMLTLLGILTADGGFAIMNETLEYYPWSWLYFVFFIFISGVVFLNLVTAVLVDAMQQQMQNKSAPSNEKGQDDI